MIFNKATGASNSGFLPIHPTAPSATCRLCTHRTRGDKAGGTLHTKKSKTRNKNKTPRVKKNPAAMRHKTWFQRKIAPQCPTACSGANDNTMPLGFPNTWPLKYAASQIRGLPNTRPLKYAASEIRCTISPLRPVQFSMPSIYSTIIGHCLRSL